MKEETLGRSEVRLLHQIVGESVLTVTDGFAVKHGCELMVMAPVYLKSQSAQAHHLFVTTACRAFREQEVFDTLKFAHSVVYFLDLSEIQGVDRLFGIKYQNLSTAETVILQSHYPHLKQSETPIRVVQGFFADATGIFPGEQGYEMWEQDCTAVHESSVMGRMFVSLANPSVIQ